MLYVPCQRALSVLQLDKASPLVDLKCHVKDRVDPLAYIIST